MFCIQVKDDFQVSHCLTQAFQNDQQAGLESLFVSQLNSRFELGSVRTESKFCYF